MPDFANIYFLRNYCGTRNYFSSSIIYFLRTHVVNVILNCHARWLIRIRAPENKIKSLCAVGAFVRFGQSRPPEIGSCADVGEVGGAKLTVSLINSRSLLDGYFILKIRNSPTMDK